MVAPRRGPASGSAPRPSPASYAATTAASSSGASGPSASGERTQDAAAFRGSVRHAAQDELRQRRRQRRPGELTARVEDLLGDQRVPARSLRDEEEQRGGRALALVRLDERAHLGLARAGRGRSGRRRAARSRSPPASAGRDASGSAHPAGRSRRGGAAGVRRSGPGSHQVARRRVDLVEVLEEQDHRAVGGQPARAGRAAPRGSAPCAVPGRPARGASTVGTPGIPAKSGPSSSAAGSTRAATRAGASVRRCPSRAARTGRYGSPRHAGSRSLRRSGDAAGPAPSTIRDSSSSSSRLAPIPLEPATRSVAAAALAAGR